MLSDRLTESIKKMKKLDAVESAALNVEKKAKNDADYRDVVSDFHNTAKKLQQTITIMDFTVTGDTAQYLSEGADTLSGAVSAGVVDADSIAMVRQQIRRKINPALTKEWKTFYQKKTTGSISKLNTIGHLATDSESTALIRANITGGSEWMGLSLSDDGKKTRLELLKLALDVIDELESRLNLSDEVRDFIVKVTTQTAKISDINDSILAWVRAEKLEERFVIRFKG